MNLKNKKVLITGSTGGIGNSLVEKFNSLDTIIFAIQGQMNRSFQI